MKSKDDREGWLVSGVVGSALAHKVIRQFDISPHVEQHIGLGLGHSFFVTRCNCAVIKVIPASCRCTKPTSIACINVCNYQSEKTRSSTPLCFSTRLVKYNLKAFSSVF